VEFAIDPVRIFLLLLMLGAASIFDVRTRKIPDVLWLICGGLGIILYVFDWQSVTSYHILSMVVTGATALLLYLYKITGTADLFALLSIAMILPVCYEFVMVPIAVLIAALMLVVFFTVLYNVFLNVSDIIKSKRIMFFEFKTESKYRKVFAFFVIHRKRKFEKFVIPAEKSMSFSPSKKSFVLLPLSSKRESFDILQLQTKYSGEIFVQNIPPLIAYMFGITIFVLFPEILSMLFYYFRLSN